MNQRTRLRFLLSTALIAVFIFSAAGVQAAPALLAQLPGEAATWQQELFDALAQLARQTRQQRIEELMGQGALDETEKDELRELLRARTRD